MGKKLRVGIAAVVALGLVGGGAVALANGGAPSAKTEQIMAKIRFTHAEGKFRQCQGIDFRYQDDSFTATGPATGDPRFTGNATAHVSQFRYIDESSGSAEGDFTITDPQTGRVKVRAQFNGVIFQGKTYSFATGKVFNADGSVDRLSANQRTFPENFAPTLQLGGDFTDMHIPAVIQRGNCTGAFTHFVADFGPPA